MQENTSKRTCQGDDCHAEIPLKRLAAVPDAKYCVTCQAGMDKPITANDLGANVAAGAAWDRDQIAELAAAVQSAS